MAGEEAEDFATHHPTERQCPGFELPRFPSCPLPAALLGELEYRWGRLGRALKSLQAGAQLGVGRSVAEKGGRGFCRQCGLLRAHSERKETKSRLTSESKFGGTLLWEGRREVKT